MPLAEISASQTKFNPKNIGLFFEGITGRALAEKYPHCRKFTIKGEMDDLDRMDPNKSSRRDMLLAKTGSGEERIRHQTDADLEIAENVFSDEAVGALLDEWLIPAVVDCLIRDLMNSAMASER